VTQHHIAEDLDPANRVSFQNIALEETHDGEQCVNICALRTAVFSHLNTKHTAVFAIQQIWLLEYYNTVMSHTSEECGYVFQLYATAIVKPFLEKAWQWPYCIIFSILHFASSLGPNIFLVTVF
jgi:hypothetical protein